MKTLLLNCSFRGEKSNSNFFLSRLEELLTGETERINLLRYGGIETLYTKISGVDALVLGVPLYVDGLPGQVVELLEKLYVMRKNLPAGLKIYGVTNMGFYESSQMQTQLRILKNFCFKAGFIYGGSLAIGAGEMMSQLNNIPIDKGPNKIMGQGMKNLADSINKGEAMPDFYSKPKHFPRWVYMYIANFRFKKMLKK